MIVVDLLAAGLLIGSLCYAAFSDFRHLIIPNWVSACIVGGFLLFGAANWPNIDLQLHFLIGGVFFATALMFWFAGWLGGGDVKLLGAVGLWLGTQNAFAFLFILAVLSLIMAGAMLVVRRVFKSATGTEAAPTVLRPVLRMAREGHFPYALPIVAAALATLPRHFF